MGNSSDKKEENKENLEEISNNMIDDIFNFAIPPIPI